MPLVGHSIRVPPLRVLKKWHDGLQDSPDNAELYSTGTVGRSAVPLWSLSCRSSHPSSYIHHCHQPPTITTSNPLQSQPQTPYPAHRLPPTLISAVRTSPLRPHPGAAFWAFAEASWALRLPIQVLFHAPHPLATAPVLKLLTFALRVPLAEKSQRSRRLLAATGEDSSASSASSASASADEQINANDNAASSGDDAQAQEQGTDSAGDTNEYA